MYINQASNEYHHLRITEIRDRSKEIVLPFVKLICYGKYLYHTNDTRCGYRVSTYSVQVFVKGRLMDYVLSELGVNDDIFVVGRSIDRKPNKYNKQRGLLAECIYKEDWLKFYGRDINSINPQDYVDTLKDWGIDDGDK